MERNEMLEFADIVAQAVVKALGTTSIGNTKSKAGKEEKSAYQKTEQLLYNYNGFKKIVAEKMQEIEELRLHGVPQKSKSIVAYSPGSGTVRGTVLQEESVEQAIRNVQDSVQGTVDAIALIDKCMAALKNDPYYKALEMRYFEGRTLEEIGVYFSCDHSTISRNKNRLVKELSMRLFPDDVVKEYLR